MLRRFEIYSLDPAAPQAKVDAMCLSMRRGPHYIPEILHSAIGHNKSEVGLHVVWEHAYDSPEAYQRYMVHPFHANIYDRYLLNDCPERIVTDNTYDVGLLGYSCETPVYWLPDGTARRLVLLRLKGDAQRFQDITAKTKAANPKMIQSVLAENTFATRWLDGVTKLFEDTTYTHIWEQGYASLADAAAAGNAWQASADGLVEKFIELWYQLEGGDNYNVGATQ
jgi:hypothetical protein